MGRSVQSFSGLFDAAGHSEGDSRDEHTEQARLRPPAEGGAVV